METFIHQLIRRQNFYKIITMEDSHNMQKSMDLRFNNCSNS